MRRGRTAPIVIVLLAAGGMRAAASEEPLEAARRFEQRRIALIERLMPAVVCLYDENRQGGGSGVIISPDGLGLTNYHVIASMWRRGKALAGFSDGSVCEVDLLGADPTGDVALFRVPDASGLPAAELGDSDTLRVGDWVLAFGNPFMLADDQRPTATFGIVSGLHRYQEGQEGLLTYSDCIQVDASINPGNSGGPLFDMQGRLVGINGRISAAWRGKVNVGLGYAIPINQIRRFLPLLERGGVCAHGTLQATVRDIAGEVVFDQVREPGVAWDAGVRPGDRLREFDGLAIATASEFTRLIGTYPAGWPVSFVFERSEERRRAEVRLARLELRGVGAEAGSYHDTPPEALPDVAPSPPVAGLVPDGLAERANAGVVKLYGAAVGQEPGFGTGIVVDAEGHVLTTASLLLEGRSVRAVTADGTIVPARVLRRDPRTELALLQLGNEGEAAPVGLRPLPIGDSQALRRGDWVLAVSNAFRVAEGSEPCSVTLGTFAGRTLLDARRGATPVLYNGPVLLVDAITSNPGSAGGALVDLEGRLVGVLGKVVRSERTNTLLNYAIPIEQALPLIRGEPAYESLAEERPPGESGIRVFEMGYRRRLVYVDRVVPDSPADRAGLRPDDLILEANGRRITSLEDYRSAVAGLRAGDELRLRVKRGGQILDVALILEARER